MKRTCVIVHLRLTSLVTGLTCVNTLCSKAQVSGLRGELFLFFRSINNIILIEHLPALSELKGVKAPGNKEH